ncbi:hypothetical protein PRZ48_006046 [Zasmidium cellare]|uniref:Secreted protein n=1 Tax=Zasmidium cellare TaxID=395010 RepID=A0ABR0EN73_ZASCE|nr:hypothetical protein PRZ48_006046 [Zasmidium cellare]
MLPSAHFFFALVAAIFVPLALSQDWAVTFYTGENCDADASYNYTTYSGDNVNSWCRIAGDAGDNCEWHINNGADTEGCTSPMQPQPKSLRFPKKTACTIGDTMPQIVGDTFSCSLKQALHGDKSDVCVKIADLHLEGEWVTFVCYDTCQRFVGEKPPECG